MTEYVAMVLGFIAGWIACATVSRTETASRRLQDEGERERATIRVVQIRSGQTASRN